MSGRFDSRVIVAQDGPWWVLQYPLVYEETDPLVRVTVPKGFVTDFASTPRLLWPVFDPTDPEYAAAAIVHDRLYESHQLVKAGADDLFYRAMAVNFTPDWKRNLIWTAVHWFGGSAYDTGPARQAERLAAFQEESA